MSRSRRSWLQLSSFEKNIGRRASLRLTSLEDRVVPAGTITIAMIDAVGYVGKSVAVKLTHTGSSSPSGTKLDWGDSSTISLDSWAYGTSSIALTHTYSADGSFKVIATDSNSVSDTITVNPDVPPALAVDGATGPAFDRFATPVGNNPSQLSPGGVRYADGAAFVTVNDLQSTGFGMPFGVTRVWSNGPGYDAGGDVGNGWSIAELPSVIEGDSTATLVVMFGGQARTFDLTATANVYAERYFGQNTLTHDTGADLYVLTTPDGVVYEFNDFTVAGSDGPGQFVSRTDPNGNLTEVTDRNGDGNPVEVTRGGLSESDITETWSFEYIDGGDNDGKLESVSLIRQPDGGSPITYRKVEYTYHDGSTANGNKGDLESVIIKDSHDSVISRQYYRYYKPGAANGFVGGLRLFVGFASYERADANPGFAFSSGSDEDLAPYADFTFQFDTERRVTQQKVQGVGCSMCSAGIGTYTYSYTDAAHGAPDGFNRWAVKTTETLPDGNANIVYTNAYGQVMLTALDDASSADVWRTHYLFDGEGRLIQRSNPSAITNINDSFPELLITNGPRLGLSTEFQVSTYTTGTQGSAVIARDYAGNYVVVWKSDGQDGSGTGIYAQRYSPVGTPQGSEFRVNTSTTGDQKDPAMAMDADGDFVVVWYDDNGYGVYAQRYDELGVAQGGEFRVNASTTTGALHPAVAMDFDGDFVVAYEDYGGDGSKYGVSAQRFNAAGSPQGGEIRVNTSTTNNQLDPAVAMDANGNFVVSWQGASLVGGVSDVFFQRYNSSGTPQGSETRANSTTGLVINPAVAMDADGDFVIAWTRYVDPTPNYDVFFQRYNEAGSTQGSETRANTTTTAYQKLQTVASDAAGNFLIVWSSNNEDGSGAGIYGQHYLADGTAGGQFRVNDYTTGSQTNQSVASDYDGNFVVVWTSAQDGNVIMARQLERTFSYLSDTSGLIERFEYGRTTTAGSSTPGDVAGFLASTWLMRGDVPTYSTDTVKQAAFQYFEKTASGVTVHPPANVTRYRNIDATGGQTTGWTYAYSSGLSISTITTTYPTVTTGQNGPNSPDTETVILDLYGRTKWSIDGGGFLTYQEFDDASGATTIRIDDVDSTETGDFDGAAPASTPGGGGLHLTSEWAVDFLGRPTAATDPKSYITYTVYNDANHEVRVYPDWDSSLFSKSGGPTGPTQVYREDWDAAYTESFTMSAQPNVSSSVPTGSEAVSSLQSLTRTNLNNAGQAVSRDDYHSFAGMSYSTAAAIGTINTNYYRSLTDYADRGGVKRTETPTGTITRYVRDAMNRVTEVWIGTDDTASKGFWSPTNTDGTDLVKVVGYTFDGGAVGDSNMTKQVQFVGGGGTDRQSDYFYDWRNRPVAVKMGVEGSESLTLTTNRPLYFFEFDNLNQIIDVKQFDGDNVDFTVTYSSGVTVAPGGTVQAHMATSFDERGRVYRESVYNGSATYSLNTDTWYDRRGLILKTLQPGGLVTKFAQDGVGRLTTLYLSNGGSDSGYGDADDVTSDSVYEEHYFEFDANGNDIKTTIKQRFHNATGTGALGNYNTQPKARISYTGSYYDRADRPTESVDVGTNATSGTPAAWSRPGSAPSSSDTIHVNGFTYDAAGLLYQSIDPRGIESRRYYDALGRTTKTIEAYDDGTPSATDDRKTEWAYDGMDHVTMYKLWLDDSDFEETGYTYGVTNGSNGNLISSKDLLAVMMYPDPDDGGPTQAQYTYNYNRAGDLIGMADINGTEHDYSFDVVGRPTKDVVDVLAEGLDDTILRVVTAYDSAGRAYLFTNFDAESSGNVVNQVERTFNGFGQVTVEKQEHDGAVDGGTPSVDYTYTLSGNSAHLTGLEYPNGEDLTFAYDGIGRPTTTKYESADLTLTDVESLEYLGLGTVVVRSLGDGTVVSTMVTGGTAEAGDQYAGLDRFGRVRETLWEDGGSADLEHFIYAHDRNGNVLYRTNELDHDFDELFHTSGKTSDADRFDAFNQLRAWSRGPLSDGNADGVFDTVSKASVTKTYARDSVGNIGDITTVEGNATTTIDRAHDFQNRLIHHDEDLTFDDVGNLLIDDLGNDYLYDAWNRLVGFNAETDRYAYDAAGRRIKEGDRELFVGKEGEVLEEHGPSSLLYQYIPGQGPIDHMTGRCEIISGKSNDVVLYAMTDPRGNVTAIADDDSEVQERYVYSPTGERTILDAERNEFEPQESASDWAAGWGSGRWDKVTDSTFTSTGITNLRLQVVLSSVSVEVMATDFNENRWLEVLDAFFRDWIDLQAKIRQDPEKFCKDYLDKLTASLKKERDAARERRKLYISEQQTAIPGTKYHQELTQDLDALNAYILAMSDAINEISKLTLNCNTPGYVPWQMLKDSWKRPLPRYPKLNHYLPRAIA